MSEGETPPRELKGFGEQASLELPDDELLRAARSEAEDEPLVPKAYYSIGEVCDLTGLKPHVLRYWETQFPILSPSKNRSGNRAYRRKDIELVLLVKHLLYDEKYTIEGARQRMHEMRRDGELQEGRQEVLAPEVLAGMKRELLVLRELLDRPGRATDE